MSNFAVVENTHRVLGALGAFFLAIHAIFYTSS